MPYNPDNCEANVLCDLELSNKKGLNFGNRVCHHLENPEDVSGLGNLQSHPFPYPVLDIMEDDDH